MMDSYLIIRASDGRVVNVSVGEPPASEGFETVLRADDAENAWIGWTRNADGTFTDTSADYDAGA
jgi:hypothetical protein